MRAAAHAIVGLNASAAWQEGGHDQLCKKIKNQAAPSDNANTKYAEAVSRGEACAEDTKGQTCYICTQALHWKTKEGPCAGVCAGRRARARRAWRSRR